MQYKSLLDLTRSGASVLVLGLCCWGLSLPAYAQTTAKKPVKTAPVSKEKSVKVSKPTPNNILRTGALSEDVPENDLCINAITFSIGETVSGSSINATNDSDVASDCGSNEVGSESLGVWYHIVGNGETVTLSTCSGYTYSFDDTSLSVYSGSCTTGLSCVAGNDDTGESGECGAYGYQSRLKFNSEEGVDYYILVDGYSNGTGEFDLSSSSEPTPTPPANDQCQDATALTLFADGEGTPVYADNTTATAYTGRVYCDEYGTLNDVWFSFNSGSSTDIIITLESVDTDEEGPLEAAESLLFVIYENCGGDSMDDDGDCFEDGSAVAVMPGADYLIQVWTSQYGGNDGTFSIQLNDYPIEKNTWDGTEWSFGEAPNGADAVLAGDYTASVDGYFYCNNLIVEEGATLISDPNDNWDYVQVYGNVYNSGSVIQKSGGSMPIEGDVFGNGFTFEIITTFDQNTGRYSMIGSPVKGSGFDALGENALIFGYDESVPYDEGVSDGLNRFKTPAQLGETVMGDGIGYFSAFTGDEEGKVTFTGMPYTGELYVPLNYTDQGSDLVNEYSGFHILANPYTVSLSIYEILDDNYDLDGAVYIWDDNGSEIERGSNSDYIIHNGSVAVQTTPGGRAEDLNYISTGQGFFVRTTANTEVFLSGEDQYYDEFSNGTYFRTSSSEPALARINLTNAAGLFKQTVIGEVDDIDMTAVDRSFDAKVFSPSAANLLYSQKGGAALAIQGITSNTEQVALGMNVETTGSYTISLGESTLSQKLYLMDYQTNKITDLSSDSYTFQATAGKNAGRFALMMSPAGVLSADKIDNNLYAYDKVLYIRSSSAESVNYRVVNLSGKVMMKIKSSGSEEISLQHLPNGIYIVTDGKEGKKIALY